MMTVKNNDTLNVDCFDLRQAFTSEKGYFRREGQKPGRGPIEGNSRQTPGRFS